MSHLVTAHRSEAQVAAQCAGKNSCAVRVPSMKLQVDEPAQVIGRLERQCRSGLVGVAYLLEERPQDTQTLSAGVLRETSGVLHVLVKPPKFVLDLVGHTAPLGQDTEIVKH